MVAPKDKHILLVEDDRSLIDFLSITIRHDGFYVSTARDGEGAFQAVQTSKPDLVVLDMMLPQKSGFELIKTLQAPEYQDIPIIVVSGRFVDDEFRRLVLFEPNVKEYLVKPLKPQQLLYKIHSLLKTVSPDQEQAEKKGKKFKDNFKPEKFERDS
jgi:two-component system alkaline phosphatase synthesis response regulator PhoP